MGQLTYRNSFLAFALIYLSTWSVGSLFSGPVPTGAGKIEIPDNNPMTGVETAISVIGLVAIYALALVVVFGASWAVLRAFTGYRTNLWEIFAYVFIVGWVSAFAVTFLFGLIFSIPASAFLTMSDNSDAGLFAKNLSALFDLVTTFAVAAWSSGIFYQQISKKLAASAADQAGAADQPTISDEG